ncbi:MAG: hypothetical protein ACE5G8_02285, partial [Anaerolineae bacterium]
LAAPPPANPVAWSLSVLWSGWLLGLQAARPRHGLLAQPWPDWDWYRQALCAVMQPLRPALKPDAVWVFDFEAADPRHAPAVTLAALKAGYRAIDWRIAGTRHRLTLAPTPPDPVSPAGPEHIKAAVRQQSRAAVDALLRQRGQPASGEQLFLAAWRALLFSGLLAQTLAALPGRQVLPWLSEQINRAIQPS